MVVSETTKLPLFARNYQTTPATSAVVQRGVFIRVVYLSFSYLIRVQCKKGNVQLLIEEE